MLTRIIAVLLLALALALGVAAYRLAQSPVPAPAQVMANEPVASVPPPAPAPVVARGRDVVVADRDLHAGDVLQPDMLAVHQWAQRPETAFSKPEALAGQVLRLPVAKGEPVLQTWLARGLATYLDPDYRALSIPVDDIAGAASTIRPGDVVDVFFTLSRDRDQIRDTQARLLLSSVQVLAYGDQSVDGPLQANDESPSRRADSGARAPRAAILAVPLNEISETLLAVRNGTLQLVLRSPDDTGRPDPALFPERPSVLTARARLSDAQKMALEEAPNQAYAGASLSGLAGAAPQDSDARSAGPSPSVGQGRRLQLIRGSQIHSVPY